MSVFDIINYDNCITNLTSSIQKHYGLKPNYKTNEIIDKLLEEKEYDNVIILVCDGMGNSIIEKNTTDNHFLKTHKIGEMLSTFPPTTANCTTSYTSGLNPISTGWLGWATYYKDLNMVIDNFPNCEATSKLTIPGDNIAEDRMGFIPLGELIQKHTNNEVTYHSVWPSFKEGGCKSLKEFEHRICKICNQPGKKYIYAYWDDPDKTMHMAGTKNDLVKKSLNGISKLLHGIERKTKNTIVITSADHSQIDVTPIAFYTYYDLLDCLYAPFSCDSRCAFFFVKDDKKEQFASLFNKYFEDKFDLLTKEEAINNHLFGKGTPHPLYESIIGDYIAIAKDKYYFLLTADAHLFKGHHAGGLKEEMSIPLIVVKN